MKRILKWIKVFIISFAIILGAITAFVVLYEKEILQYFTQEINKKLTTDIHTSGLNLTFWETFPNISVKINDPVAMDAIPGSTDTLLKAESLYLSFDLISLAQKKYTINQLHIKNAVVKLKRDQKGHNNYSIIKKDSSSKNKPFSFALDKIILEETLVYYIDQSVQNNHQFLAHDCEAELVISHEKLDLDLEGNFFIHHITVGENTYIFQKNTSLNTTCSYSFKTQKFEIEPSDVVVEDAQLNVSGLVENKEKRLNIQFSAPETNVKHILILLPRDIQNSLANYRSDGSLYFKGKMSGKYGVSNVPRVDLEFGFDKASFFHPDLKEKITNASLEGRYSNGRFQNKISSILELKNVKGKIGSDLFEGSFSYINFADPTVDLQIRADVGVQTVLDFFPINELEKAKGKLGIELALRSKLETLKNLKSNADIASHGSLNIRNGMFKLKGNKLNFNNINGEFLFNNQHLGITQLQAKINNSDLQVSGIVKNFFGFIFRKVPQIEIESDLRSQHIDLDELLANKELTKNTNNNTKGYNFTISDKINVTFNFIINELKFRRLSDKNILKNFKGEFQIENRIINYHNLSGKVCDGSFNVFGSVDARKKDLIKVKTKGKLTNIDLHQFFYSMENFGQDFITDQNLRGKLDCQVSNFMTFDHTLKLDLNSVLSKIDMQIKDGQLNHLEPLIELGSFLKKNQLSRYLKKPDLKEISFSKLENQLFIEKKKITIPQMSIVSDASSEITVNGKHSFENEFDYFISFPLTNYKKQARDAEYGIRPKDASERLYIFLELVGNPDDFDIRYDKKAIFESVVKSTKDNIKNVFEPIDKQTIYYGIEEDSTEMIDFDVYD